MASPDENVSSGELRGLSATLREAKERDAEVRRQGTAGEGAYQTVHGKWGTLQSARFAQKLPNASSLSAEESAGSPFVRGCLCSCVFNFCFTMC